MNEGAKILEFTGARVRDPIEKKEELSQRVIEFNRFGIEDPTKPVVLATCKLEDGEISFEGDGVFIKSLERDGVITINGEKVFPRDGKKFFEALPINFRNPYFRAVERRSA